MRISQDRLEELLQEEYRTLEERLRTWVRAAEAELEEGARPGSGSTTRSFGRRHRQTASACSWAGTHRIWMRTPLS